MAIRIGDIVVVEHEWTKERQRLPLESFTEQFIYVRWGMSGLYEVKLASGVLRACSVKARQKGTARLWSVVGIGEWRRAIREHFHPNQTVERMKQHEKTMPFKDGGPRKTR